MYIKNIMFSLKSKKIWIVIILAVIVAAILICYTTFCVVNNVKNKEYLNEYSSIISSLGKENIFNATSYEAEYELTVISNKNRNVYNVKEWYLNKSQDKNTNEYFKYILSGSSNEEAIYLIKDNTLTIKNYNQIGEYKLENYIGYNTNLMSIKTFVDLYKNIENEIVNNNSVCCFKTSSKLNEDNICLYIQFLNNAKIDESCNLCEKYKDILKYGLNIDSIELILDFKTKIPISINIYDKNMNIIMSITYKSFVLNNQKDEKVFAF